MRERTQQQNEMWRLPSLSFPLKNLQELNFLYRNYSSKHQNSPKINIPSSSMYFHSMTLVVGQTELQINDFRKRKKKNSGGRITLNCELLRSLHSQI